MNRQILVIDDDRKLAELLGEFLARYALDVTPAATPELGLALLRSRPFDLIVLDVMLPERSGFELLKDIRAECRVPVIMLTARGEVNDRIVGLELGADDYLAKPFEPRELVARIQSVLRRGEVGPGRRLLVYGGLEIDREGRRVLLDGQALELSTSEFDVLALLAGQPGRVVSREQIIDGLRGADWATSGRAVDVVVSRLRQKLGDDPRNSAWIKTVWGSGYSFVGRGGR